MASELRTLWRCTECDWTGPEDLVLHCGQWSRCPSCGAPEHFVNMCDEPGCTREATCGWAVWDGDYRRTCFDHSSFAKEMRPVTQPRPKLQANPFMHAGHWYWRDENDKVSRAFASQRAALRDLLRTLDAREHWWDWLCQKTVEFWHDTRGSSKGAGKAHD